MAVGRGDTASSGRNIPTKVSECRCSSEHEQLHLEMLLHTCCPAQSIQVLVKQARVLSPVVARSRVLCGFPGNRMRGQKVISTVSAVLTRRSTSNHCGP